MIYLCHLFITHTGMDSITGNLLRIITEGNHKPNCIELFKDALKKELTQCDDKAIYAVAAICTLYISHFRAAFPMQKLRTFNTNIRQEITLPLFDCRLYNTILSSVPEESLESVELFDAKNNIKSVPLKKQDIIEALDFYTNQ